MTEITPEQQVAMLEETRARLVGQRVELQRKIGGVRERMEKTAQREKERELAFKTQK